MLSLQNERQQAVKTIAAGLSAFCQNSDADELMTWWNEGWLKAFSRRVSFLILSLNVPKAFSSTGPCLRSI